MTDVPNSPEGTPTQGTPGSKPARRKRHRLAPLPLGVRLLVLFVGGLLVAIGIAGLLLPGIQGIVTILLGAAVLSLASDWIYKLQRRMLSRWPRVSERNERFRHRIHNWLSRHKHADDDPEPPPTE